MGESNDERKARLARETIERVNRQAEIDKAIRAAEKLEAAQAKLAQARLEADVEQARVRAANRAQREANARNNPDRSKKKKGK